MELKYKDGVFFTKPIKTRQNRARQKTLCVIKDYIFIPKEKVLN